MKRLFSASVQKSLPAEMVVKEGGEGESGGHEKQQACIPAQVILQHMRCLPEKHLQCALCEALQLKG